MSHYADEGEDLMSRATDLPTPSPHPRTGPVDLRGKHVCPFCGAVNAQHDGDVAAQAGPCPRCSMADTPATRKATKARIGPWFVRQTRNPAAPGMRFDTLLALVKRGQVTAQSVVRGPTTYQLWRFAANVKGLSRAFGLCYSCGGSVEPDATLCPHCNRMQEPPTNPDVLLEPTLAPATVAPPEPIRKEIRPVDPRPMAPAPVAPPQPPAYATQTYAAAPAPLVTAPPPRAAAHYAPAPHSPAPVPETPAHHDDIFTHNDEPLEDLDSGPLDRRPVEEIPAPPRRDRQIERRRNQLPERQRPAASADNAILSARDLAAAFQLDFKPSMRPRRKWFRKLAAAVVLLALAGGAALLVANEEMRQTTLSWTQRQYATVREAIVSRVQAPPETNKPAAPAPTVAGGGRPSDINPPSINASSRDALAARDVKPLPSESLTKAPPATLAAATQPAVVIAPAPAPAPAPRVEQPRTPPPAPAVSSAPPPEPIDPAVAAEEARTLWRKAIDAEARRDFAAAVESYEQIKKLPKNVWPGGLEINLDLARKRLQ